MNKTFASATAQKLSQRHNQTTEVTQVLTGQGYKSVKPSYKSQPDIQKAEVQHQVLSHDFDKFQDCAVLYGKKANLRDQDPAMDEILGWGQYDPPVKNDFTNNKGAFQEKYKINKMGVEFISEKQDNFRNPQNKLTQAKEEQIIHYVQDENQVLTKKKILNNLDDKKQMEYHTTEYREHSKKNDPGLEQSKSLYQFYDKVTVAGQARYLDAPALNGSSIVMPQQYKDEQLERGIKAAWRVVDLEPHLQREIEKTNDDMLDIKNQQSLLSQVTSVSQQRANQKAQLQQAIDQQEKELNDEQKQELREKLKELKLTSRWLPDSSLTTYFGKPAFHAYGNGNTKPTIGGSVYGQFMKTFNVNPHAGGNKPEYSQVHARTLLGGTVQVRAPGNRAAKKRPVSMTRKPMPPRIAPQKSQRPQSVVNDELKARLPVAPETFEQAQARELTILPPTFNEKNLQTKNIKDEGDFAVNVRAKKSQAATSITGSRNPKDNQYSESASQAQKTAQMSSIDHSRSVGGYSAQEAQDISERDQSRRQPSYGGSPPGPDAQNAQNIPYCGAQGAYGGSQAREIEVLQLNDPRNYKFLPPQFTEQIRAAGKTTVVNQAVSSIFA